VSDDDRHLLACIELAEQAAGHGNFPFAALLVDAEGRVLAHAENTVATEGDCTGHAELNLMRDASRRLDRDLLATCTVYASAEPCAMCAAAIYWGNVRRVVFALSCETVQAIVDAAHPTPTLTIGCREVFDRSAYPIDVRGPFHEDAARASHDRYWAAAFAAPE
jgi:tRNA(Arg) A34 adenosine deaminase TadA